MEETKYLVLLRLPENDTQINLSRVQAAKETAEKIGKGQCQMAFSTSDASFLGLFVKTSLAAAQIRARFDALIHREDRAFVWVLALADEFAAIGNSRGWQWLQHN